MVNADEYPLIHFFTWFSILGNTALHLALMMGHKGKFVFSCLINRFALFTFFRMRHVVVSSQCAGEIKESIGLEPAGGSNKLWRSNDE